MNELVFKSNDQAVTSTTNVATNFSREHHDVIKSVERLRVDVGTFSEMFFETTEPDSYGRPRKVFLMNRDGFTLLAMGFTGSKAMEFKVKYINEFNRMEQFLNSPEMIVQRAMEIQNQKVKQLENHIEENKRFTEFGKVVEGSNASINIGAFAKLVYEKHGINLGRNRMMKWLRDNGYLMKSGREKNFPKQPYVEQGLFTLRPTVIKRTQGDVQSGTPMITGKGQVAITEILMKEFKKSEVI